MGFTAVVRVWVMEEVLLVVVMLVGCTHQVTVLITCHGGLMLVVALTHHFIPAVEWEAAVTWVVGALDHTTEINYDKDAAVGSGLFQAYAIMMPTVLERAYYRA